MTEEASLCNVLWLSYIVILESTIYSLCIYIYIIHVIFLSLGVSQKHTPTAYQHLISLNTKLHPACRSSTLYSSFIKCLCLVLYVTVLILLLNV